jgi:ABC-type glycerol-3-phosphate transport system substrate-binding protein
MRRLALVVAAGLVLAGCGGGHMGSSPTTNSAAADKAQIRSAYEKFFSGQTSVSDRVALLQNGSAFKSVIEAFASNPLAKHVSASVSSVKLQGANDAMVVYTVKLGGVALPKQTGNAVRENGTWKVGDASLCKLVSLQGTTPAACKS